MQSLYLLYHEIRTTKSEYSYVVERGDFVRQMDLFARLRENAAQVLPEITFDDGHVSNLEVALPVLVARGLQARFFITVGWTGQKLGYMDWAQLRDLRQAGQHVGAHGWTHTLLTHCSAAQLDHELRGARLALEDKLNASITTMSLPGGRYNKRVIEACREAGYTEIFTSIPRAETEPPMVSTSPRLVGRINVRGDMSLLQIEALLVPSSAALKSLERQYGIKSAVQAVLGDVVYAKLWGLLNRQEVEDESHEAELQEAGRR